MSTTKRRDDLEITVRLKNNHLKARRDELGLSLRDFASAAGVVDAKYQALENLRVSPIKVHRDYSCRAPACAANQRRLGALFCVDHLKCNAEERDRWLSQYVPRPEPIVWTDTAAKVAEFYSVAPEELFPDAILSVANPVVVSTANVPDLISALGIAQGDPVHALQPDIVDEQEKANAVRRVLATLTPREEKVLRMRFGIGEKSDHTNADIADMYGVGPVRISQIEARALRKLRDPSRVKHLRDWKP